ncbi:MAG: thioredoxin-related protein [Enterobacterales bacterium]|jgi:thioredoxin-related protein
MKDLRFWITLAAEIAFAILIFIAVSSWQEKDMLDSKSEVPVLSAVALDGKTYQIPANSSKTGKKTLLYFFAPWCNICHLSIGNLNILRGQIDESELDIIIVALDWKSKQEVELFIEEHELNYPVLLGTTEWQEQYKIQGFPSYYVIDPEGKVLSHSMGYSSSIGMLRRTLFN